ncbi:hypothetical protein GCM10023166_05290 [Paeniglutamicibacter cryotolerans]
MCGTPFGYEIAVVMKNGVWSWVEVTLGIYRIPADIGPFDESEDTPRGTDRTARECCCPAGPLSTARCDP